MHIKKKRKTHTHDPHISLRQDRQATGRNEDPLQGSGIEILQLLAVVVVVVFGEMGGETTGKTMGKLMGNGWTSRFVFFNAGDFG